MNKAQHTRQPAGPSQVKQTNKFVDSMGGGRRPERRTPSKLSQLSQISQKRNGNKVSELSKLSNPSKRS